jgi:hypothetical protein
MGLVDDAFTKLKSNLEITQTEAAGLPPAERDPRSHLRISRTRPNLPHRFLRPAHKDQGGQGRGHSCVLKPDGADAGLRQQSPSEVLTHLQSMLSKKHTAPMPEIGRRSCSVQFSGQDEDPSFDVVLAVDRDGGGYEIPDRFTGAWIATDPEIHKAKATEKNALCDGKWIPVVKMIKGWNREWDKPVRRSFLLEVMALKLIRPPYALPGRDRVVPCQRGRADLG